MNFNIISMGIAYYSMMLLAILIEGSSGRYFV